VAITQYLLSWVPGWSEHLSSTGNTRYDINKTTLPATLSGGFPHNRIHYKNDTNYQLKP